MAQRFRIGRSDGPGGPKLEETMTSRQTGIIYDHRFMEHNTGLALVSAGVPADSIWEPQPHAASPQLVGRAYRLLERTGVLARLASIPARQATIEQVARVH